MLKDICYFLAGAGLVGVARRQGQPETEHQRIQRLTRIVNGNPTAADLRRVAQEKAEHPERFVTA